jgi:hypothetical protein
MVEVCQQLRERDMKIIGLESRVMELDRQVIDLQVEIIVTEVNWLLVVETLSVFYFQFASSYFVKKLKFLGLHVNLGYLKWEG